MPPPPPTTDISTAFVSPALHRVPRCSSHSQGGERLEPQGLGPCGLWLPLTCHLPHPSGISPSAGASCVPPPPHPLRSHPFSFSRLLAKGPSLLSSICCKSVPAQCLQHSHCFYHLSGAVCSVDPLRRARSPSRGCPVSPWVPPIQPSCPFAIFSITFMRPGASDGYVRLHLTKHDGSSTFQKALWDGREMLIFPLARNPHRSQTRGEHGTAVHPPQHRDQQYHL